MKSNCCNAEVKTHISGRFSFTLCEKCQQVVKKVNMWVDKESFKNVVGVVEK